MSIKPSQCEIFIVDGKLVIGRLNNKGVLRSDYKDISQEVSNFFVKRMESEKGRFVHKIIDGDHYEVICRKLSDEDLEELEVTRKKRSEKATNNISNLLSLINPQSRSLKRMYDMCTSPVKSKTFHD